MAPKKAPPSTSKKNDQKKKNQSIEDKTFGLKNKNKSKKVQQHIQSVTKSVLHSGDPKQRKLEEQRKQAKAAAKVRKKAEEAERDALFGEALLAVSKKKSTNQKDGKIEAKGRDGDDDAKKKGTSRAMKMMYQMDAQEMNDRLREDPNYVPTLEDEIEVQRQKKVADLKAKGTKGTPITPETFAVWQESKRRKRAEQARKLVEAEFKKKKGGKGLAVLSGRDLYEYKKDLFQVNDDDVIDEEEEQVDGNYAPTKNGEDNNNNNNTKAEDATPDAAVEVVAEKVQTDLFLAGDDDDLDDLDDDE